MKKDVYRLAAIGGGLVLVLIVAAVVYLRGQRQKEEVVAASTPPASSSTLVRPHSRSMGPADAKVTVVEFFDPECESCRAIYPTVKAMLKPYQDQGKVRLVLRYMPMHRNSAYAASALEAGGEQGKYWELLEALFEQQPRWGDHHAPKPELIPEIASSVGLNMSVFQRSVNSAAHKALIETDKADGLSLGVTGTPTFFVNGRMLQRLDYAELKGMIDRELAR